MSNIRMTPNISQDCENDQHLQKKEIQNEVETMSFVFASLHRKPWKQLE